MELAPRPRIAVAVGIVVEGGRILICRRPPHVPLPGLWEFPGGKIEPGESAAAAAVRELKEETNLDVIAVRRLPAIEHAYPHAHVTLTPILCRRTAGQAEPLQCTEVRWVAPNELSHYAFPPGNAALLQSLARRGLEGLDV